MMKKISSYAVFTAIFALALLWAVGAFAAEVKPPVLGIGNAKFYPSAERPIGYRGDGNGYYPEATVPADWWSGTPAEKMKAAGTFDPKRDDGKYTDLADSIPHNVLWKTQLPSWANSQPLVVGDKVFTTGEPDYLICVDAQSGKVLWTRQLSPWDLIGLDAAKAKQIRDLYEIQLALQDFGNLEFHFNTCGRYFTLEKYKPMADIFIEKSLPNILKRLKEIDPEGQYDDPAKKTVDALNAFMAAWKPSGQGYEGTFGVLTNAVGRRIQTLQGTIKELKSQKRGFSQEMPWGNIVGFCPSTPVSDGKYVYVSMGQGQTACYDLEGNRIWARIVDGPAPSTFQVISPVLCGDVFIDMHNPGNKLTGLDKNTGKTLWESNITPPKGGGGYFIASHKLVHLTNGKEEMDVLVTSPTAVVRVTDGKVLGFLPYSDKPYGGSSLNSMGDIIIKTVCGDGYSGPTEAFKLKMIDKDTLDITKIWGNPNSPDYDPHTVIGDYIYMNRGIGKVFDVKTGNVMVGGNTNLGDESDIAAGNLFFWTQQGSRQWNNRREDGKVIQRFNAADISDSAKPRTVSLNNWLGGLDPVACSYIHTYLADLEFNPEFYNLKGGNPAHFAMADTTTTAHGNRLFIRSVGYLYSIGDPAESYCNQPYPTGDKLLDEPKAENLNAIVAKLSSTDRQVQLASAVALRKLGADAAPATDALLKLFTSDDEKEAIAGYLGLRALQLNGAKAVDTLVEFGKKGPAQKVRAIAIMADMGDNVAIAASKLFADEKTYQYGLEILQGLHNANDAKAMAVLTAIKSRTAGNNYLTIPILGNNRGFLLAADLMKSLGKDAAAAGPELAKLGINDETRFTLRVLSALASVAPELATKRLPQIVTMARGGGWEGSDATYIINDMGAAAKDALPELQKLTESADSRKRATLVSVINNIATQAKVLWISSLDADVPGTVPGGEVKLSWKALNAKSVSIDQGIGVVKDEDTVTVKPQETTTYTITAEGEGGPVTKTLTVKVVPAAPAVTPAATTAGLAVDYYALTDSKGTLPDFTTLKVDKTDVVNSLDWRNGASFATSGRTEQVAAKFTGYIDVPVAGLYTFTCASLNGSALFIGDVKVVDNDGAHNMKDASGQIGLAAGKHPITITYAKSKGDQGMAISWIVPGKTSSSISASVLSH